MLSLVHLVCSSQEIILQRHHLPPVVCNVSMKPPSFWDCVSLQNLLQHALGSQMEGGSV